MDTSVPVETAAEELPRDSSAKSSQPQEKIRLEFSGNGKEFFKIWIVNLFRTIVTFGIYSAWAKVRTNQYFYSNTSLAGNAFQYLAEPMNILKGRIVAIVLFALYSVVQNIYPQYAVVAFVVLMLLIPALIVLSLSFRLRNTAYRNITFHFNRDFKKVYLLFAIPVLLLSTFVVPLMMHQNSEEVVQSQEYNQMVQEYVSDGELTVSEEVELDAFAQHHNLALDENGMAVMPSPPAWAFIPYLIMFLLFPLWDKIFTAFKVNNSQFGTSSFKFDGTSWDFYKMYLLFLGITIGLGVFITTLAVFFQQTGASMGTMAVTSGLTAFSVFAVYLLMFAYYTVYKHNLMANKTSVEDVKLVSQLEITGMWWIYFSNTLLIAFTLGLATPWAKVRTARYKLERTAVICSSLDNFVAKQEKERRALGEEIGEAFDVDIGF